MISVFCVCFFINYEMNYYISQTYISLIYVSKDQLTSYVF